MNYLTTRCIKKHFNLNIPDHEIEKIFNISCLNQKG